MNLGIGVIDRGKLLVTLCLALMPALAGCGKSDRPGEDGDNGQSGTGNRGGTTGSGGSSGSAARGGGGANGGSGTGGTTSNGAVTRVMPGGVDKIDLLFMIDNSISMGDKQRVLSEAVPVLVQRLIDPICVDENGNPANGSASSGCVSARPEFTPIKDIHIGIITSSLGNHGGEVCVANPSDVPPRTVNDAAQLLPSVRTTSGLPLHSYADLGFLVWDPRVGAEIPAPDPHPGKTSHETAANEFVSDFTAHVQAAGERGCGYESQLEAWYRFLVDPEPISEVTNSGGFNVRGAINSVVLEQRDAFLRPDSLLAIVMLTDENDCSINDENGQQGWMVGQRTPMARARSECAHPEDPDVYRCCQSCLSQEVAGCPLTAADPACALGSTLMPIEDSMNLRCFDHVRRFGVNLLYPWQRYADALVNQRIALRSPGPNGETEVTNPIYRAGADGTPPRDQGLVFLVGIVGVPWQDLASEASLSGRLLTYLTSDELTASGRWDVILGDPDRGIPPTDPFMLESDQNDRTGTNPITNDAVSPAGSVKNNINGNEQNIVNRDDLQYACLFDLVPDVPCTTSNQDSCECNISEQAYARPTCAYLGADQEGTQTHARAYPGIRHLQVMKGLGDKAITASICPKNVQAMGGVPASDPDYGYNPAVAAMISRFTRALGARCLPRPFETDTAGRISCSVVETRPPSSGASCSCTAPGRTEISGNVRGFVEDELIAGGYCGGTTGVSCSDYCLCEIQQLSGFDLNDCQSTAADPGNVYGFCYIDPDNGEGDPALVAGCPATERRLVRFLGPDVPAPNAATFVVCTDL
jgi:hypothetical protein